MTNLQDQADFDLDEDLFDFAGVARESETTEPDEDLDQIFASFRDPLLEEELLDVPAAPSTRPPPEPPLGTPAPAPPLASPAAQARPAPARQAHVASPQAPAGELVPAARQARLSKSMVAVALAVTVLNSALAVVVLGRRGGETDVRAVSTEPETPGHAPQAAPRTVESRLPDPEGLGELHAHPVLDEARAQISRGEYSAARQGVYGLLAIIDRLDDPRRSVLEADCRFLIAQSLHLEALARMGGAR